MSDFLKRTITALFGILALIYIINKGGPWVSSFVFLISLIGIREFFQAFKNNQIVSIKVICYLSTLLIFLTNIIEKLSLGTVLSFTLITIFINFIFTKKATMESMTLNIFGIIYIPLMLNFINLLAESRYIWLLLIIVFSSDSFAYLTGNLMGKHKLYPSISPHKTIEGFIGGILGSILITLLYAKLIGINPLWHIIILSFIASILGQFGDLFASKIKRLAKIKDFGFIMPGHGGILDRFDSLIITAPFLYYYLKYFLI